MSEPIKLTQAQALFAVLAGSAQARRERVYYRDGVLKTTFYGTLLNSDKAISSQVFTIDIINGYISEINDVANSKFNFELIATEPLDPKINDHIVSEFSFSINIIEPAKPNISDAAINNRFIGLIVYTAVYFYTQDIAKSSHSVQVTAI